MWTNRLQEHLTPNYLGWLQAGRSPQEAAFLERTAGRSSAGIVRVRVEPLNLAALKDGFRSALEIYFGEAPND